MLKKWSGDVQIGLYELVTLTLTQLGLYVIELEHSRYKCVGIARSLHPFQVSWCYDHEYDTDECWDQVLSLGELPNTTQGSDSAVLMQWAAAH